MDRLIYENSQKYIELAIRDADKLWVNVRETFAKNPRMRDWSDDRKIEHFYATNTDFYKEFPIVSRYMITMGQYSTRAFQKYLTNKALDAKNMPAEREKGHVEDKWIRREADYIMYLWKDFTRGKRNEAQAKMVWQHAYDSLKTEFKDFRDTYRQTELKVREETKLNQKELTKEILRRISSSPVEQKLDPSCEIAPAPKPDDSTLIQVRDALKQRLCVQRKAKMLQELTSKVKKIL